MPKQFYQQLFCADFPVLITYLGMLVLVYLLTILYQLPQIFWLDLVRFSLPIVLIWFIASAIHQAHRLHQIMPTTLKQLKPTTPTEAQLIKLFQSQNQRQITTIQQLRLKQRNQLDHLELFSHEIKNSLTGLNALAENNSTVASPQVKNNIQQANYYLNLLLNDERLALDHHDFVFQWVDLTTMINTILKTNSALFIQKQLLPHLDQFTGVQIHTDGKWLRFVVEQLLSNAIKYSPTGAPINISWEINHLSIQDHGPGIPASDLHRIFENGFTGQNGHQTTASTGMGLYLVKKLSDQLNFEVKISTNSIGTLAQVTFPAKQVRQ